MFHSNNLFCILWHLPSSSPDRCLQTLISLSSTDLFSYCVCIRSIRISPQCFRISYTENIRETVYIYVISKRILFTFCVESERIRCRRCRLNLMTAGSPSTPNGPARSFQTVIDRLFGIVWLWSCVERQLLSDVKTLGRQLRYPDCTWILQI